MEYIDPEIIDRIGEIEEEVKLKEHRIKIHARAIWWKW